jgi:hypothetical protein
MIYNASGLGGASSSDPALIDLLPPADSRLLNPALTKLGTAKDAGLAASPNPSSPGQSVTFTLTICPPSAGKTLCPTTSPAPIGVASFFDGKTVLCQGVPLVNVGGTKVSASCSASWANWGTRAISAIYCPSSWTPCDNNLNDQSPPHQFSSTDVYNPIGDALTQTISAPANSALAPISLTGTGVVRLYGPTSGPYAGLTIFQARESAATITISSEGAASACNGDWMTAGVPNGTAPSACGAIGGLRGTVYAAHQNALVYISASGLANLQVIAGKIRVDSDANARFAYTPQFFVNGTFGLAE